TIFSIITIFIQIQILLSCIKYNYIPIKFVCIIVYKSLCNFDNIYQSCAQIVIIIAYLKAL
ncbi:hypothetical protein, partial [Holdemanella biformis]|uniref:hypothetical protein n=1 Tax=Holdemanella biformis TaxID=1735 RepID=UPI003A920C88